MIQTLMLIWAFALILFVREKAVKSAVISVIIVTCALGYFVVQDFPAFTKNMITSQSASYMDYHMYRSGKPIADACMMGILVRWFHVPEEWLISHYPGEMLAAAIGLGFWVCCAIWLKRCSVITAVKLGSSTFMIMAFMMKYAINPLRYYLGPGLALLILDPLKTAARGLWSQRFVRLVATTVMAAHLILFAWLHALVARSFDFPLKSEKSFSFAAGAQMESIPVDLADASTTNPRLRMKAGSNFGWANSQFGHQFWVMTPPGRYVTTICSSTGTCLKQEDWVMEKQSQGLHIPFMIERSEVGAAMVTKGNPSDLGVEGKRLKLTDVTWFAVRRLE
jgi:hypothetical protein